MAFDISGTVYTDAGVTPMGAGRTLNCSVNGAASSASTTTGADGTYTLSGVTASSGQVITIYIQDGVNPEKAVTVTRSPNANVSGVDLYQSHLVLRSDDGSPLTSSNMNASDNSGATGITAVYSFSGGLIVASGNNLYVAAGQTYSTTSIVTLTAGDLTVAGTYVGTTSAVTLSSGNFRILAGGTWTNASVNATVFGDWSNEGTYTFTAGTITLRGTGSRTLRTGGSSLRSVTLQTTGTYTLQDDLTLSNVLTLSSGTLDAGADRAISTGTWTRSSGSFVCREGSVTVTSTSSLSHTSALGGPFYNLTIGPSASVTLTAIPDIDNDLTLASGCTLNAQSNAFTVGGDWVNQGGTLSGTGTVTLDGTNQTISGSTTFYNLTKSVASADTLTFTAGTTQTVTGTLTLNGASGQLLSLHSSSSPSTWTIDAQGDAELSYLAVKDSIATTPLNAGATSTNELNNTGWSFGAVTSVPQAQLSVGLSIGVN